MNKEKMIASDKTEVARTKVQQLLLGGRTCHLFDGPIKFDSLSNWNTTTRENHKRQHRTNYTSQDSWIMDGTVKENITMGLDLDQE
mgnify:CR=1 FL=1